jgi:hypothetical protein
MARPGLTQHRKFLRLARTLGSAPLALGCLELMWEKCYLNGEAYLGDAVDVEAAAQWPGESGALCRALLEAGGEGNAGFIEEIQDRPGHFEVHDLFDHAPRYVGKRLTREIERKEKGANLSEIRAAAGRRGAEVTNGKRAASSQQVDGKRSATCRENPANGQQIAATPAPAPAPAPAPIKETACAELPPAPPAPEPLLPSEPPIAELPCVGRGPSAWPISQRQLDEWALAFPRLDLHHEIRKMRLWLEANPARRKTFRGMAAFALSWLGRAQDSPTPGSSRASPPPRTPQADQSLRHQVSAMSWPSLPAGNP